MTRPATADNRCAPWLLRLKAYTENSTSKVSFACISPDELPQFPTNCYRIASNSSSTVSYTFPLSLFVFFSQSSGANGSLPAALWALSCRAGHSSHVSSVWVHSPPETKAATCLGTISGRSMATRTGLPSKRRIPVNTARAQHHFACLADAPRQRCELARWPAGHFSGSGLLVPCSMTCQACPARRSICHFLGAGVFGIPG